MVLVITDNEQFSVQVTQWLDGNGYPYSLAHNGRQGLEWAQEFSPTVVLLDLCLTDPKGIDVLYLIREQGYKGDVILFAGASMCKMRPEAFCLGTDPVRGKPWNFGSLERAIQSALVSGVSVQPSEPLNESEKSHLS